MATEEIKIKVTAEGVEEASNGLDTLTNSFENNSQAVEENARATELATNKTVQDILKREEARHVAEMMTSTMATLATKIGEASRMTDENARNTALMKAGWDGITGAVMAFNPVMGGALVAVTSVVEAFHEWEESQQRLEQSIRNSHTALTRLNLDVTLAREASHGLVSEQTLATAAVNANNNGLRLNAQQLAGVVSASREYAETSGRDINEVFTEMTQALSTGNIPALREFGLVTQDQITQDQARLQSLDRINVAYSQSQRTFQQNSEALQRLGVDTYSINLATQALSKSTDDLSTAERTALRNVSEANERINNQKRALDQARLAAINNASTNISELMRMRDAYANNPLVLTTIERRITEEESRLDAEALAETERMNAEHAAEAEAARSRGGGGGAREQETSASLLNNLIQRQNTALQNQNTYSSVVQEHLSAEELIRQTNFEKDQERMQIQFQLAEEQNTRRLQQLEEQRQAQQRAAEEAQQAIEARQEEQTQNRYNQSIEGTNTLLQQSAAIAQTMHQQGAKAAKTQLKEWLKGFAIQEALKGGSDLAQGIASTIMNPPNAAAHYAGAAKHFALAAIAGGSAAGIKGGGGSGASASGSASSPKPSSPTGGESNQQGTGTVIINVTGQGLATEASIGRSVQNALNAYNARY